MRILGIDPGVQNIGLSILDITDQPSKIIYTDTYSLSKADNCYREFQEHIYNIICGIDHDVAIEKPFFHAKTLAKNIRTLELIGIIKLTCQISYPYHKVIEYAPASIKKELTGNGKATKQEVIDAIYHKFNLNLSTHEADASAVAYTHYKKCLL